MMQDLPRERLMVADISQSMGEFAFEETRRYVKERKAFGKPIAELKV
ncbi:unnamed protein product [Protopolystoma xenopodis]|uniref:Acyl-CoA dehydrogenase/oxidase C-terminal domain-containing protein n=1 Tax=Protopolystoma xenopodis TaxID=117903 RepID=A0A3S5A745_9PLAT|nr:unnamed protein product [Protopolystoma xenopodis]